MPLGGTMAIEPNWCIQRCIGSEPWTRDEDGLRPLTAGGAGRGSDVVMPAELSNRFRHRVHKQEGWTLEDVGKIIPVRVTPNGSPQDPSSTCIAKCARRNLLARARSRWFPRGTRMLARMGTGPNDGAFRRFGRVRPNGAFMFLRS